MRVTPLEALRAKWGDKVDIRFAQGYEKLSTFVEGSNNGQSSGTFSSRHRKAALLKEAVEGLPARVTWPFGLWFEP